MSIFNPDGPRQGELLPSVEATVPRPFVGFLPRAFAFLIDGIALYALAGMLLRGLGGPLLNLNPWLPYLGQAVGFLYFLLAAGPLGRGRTVGMAVLGLHIVGRDGAGLGWPAALRRTLLLYPAIFGVMNLRMVDWQYYLLAWPAGSHYAGLLAMTFLGLCGLTMAIAQALSIAMHPYKNGWHDQWAGAFVTRDPTPGIFLETLASPADVPTERKLANHLKLTVGFWLVSLAVLGYGAVQQLLRGDVRAQMADVAAVNAGALADSPLTAAFLSYPSTEALQLFEAAVRRDRAMAAARNETQPTTDSLRLRYLDGQTLFLLLYQRRGPFLDTDADDPDFRRRMTSLREQVLPLWQDYRARWEKETRTPAPPARQFVVLVLEQAQILFYGRGRPAIKVQGPADPAAGPLEFQLRPLAANAMTSSSTATAGTTSKPAATALPSSPGPSIQFSPTTRSLPGATVDPPAGPTPVAAR